jgi:PAS domain S-box-containing protein
MSWPEKPFNYVYAAGISGTGLCVSLLTHSPASILMAAVFAATVLCGSGPGLFSFVTTAAGFDCFFMDCRFAGANEPTGPVRLVIFIIASFAAWGTVRHKQSIDAAHRKLSERLRLIVENSPVGILSVDFSGNIRRANISAAGTFGYQAGELIGRSVKEILPDLTLSLGGTGDEVGLQKSGGMLYTQVTPVELSGESDVSCVLFIRDVTDEERAMRMLLRKEADLRLFRESVSGFNWNAGPAGEVSYVDIDRVDTADWPSCGVRDTGWLRLIYPDDRQRAGAAWADSVANVTRHDVTWRCLQAGGSYRWLRFIAEPVFDDGGCVVRWDGVAVDVHDLKQTEEQLRDSEKALRLTLESVPGMICVWGGGAHLEYANEYVLAYIGCNFSEIAGLGWLKTIHPEDIARVLHPNGYETDASEPFGGEHRMRRFDGEYRWFDVRVSALRNAAGPVSRWYALLVDIDDRKRAEQALEASERSLKRIVDTVPGMICVASPTGELIYVNQHLLNYIGTDVTAISWKNAIHPDDYARAMTAWKTSLSDGRPMEIVHRLRRADGEYRWFRGRVVPLSCGGEVSNRYGLLHDIHDQRLAEEALRESERRFRLFIDTLPAQVWCATPDGRPAYFSRRYADYTGVAVRDPRWQGFDDHAVLDRRDALMKWSDILHPDDAIATVSMLERALEVGESYETKCRIRRFDGAYKWFHVRGEPLRDSSDKIVNWYGFNIDIDDAMKMEEALRKTQSRLSRASRIASVAELSASIAHEISQPLAAVVTNAYACQRWLGVSPPNVARALTTMERILRDGNEAAEVLIRIRALFKKTALTKTFIDMNEVILEVRQLVVDDTRSEGAIFALDLAQHLPYVFADRLQMQQVLINLIHNGLDAMEVVVDRPKTLLLRSFIEDNSLTVEVCDNGCGLEDLESVFEAFVTTKEKGMGMGLAICHSIIDAHGGRLRAIRNPVHGTTLSFSLPLHQSTAHECT